MKPTSLFCAISGVLLLSGSHHVDAAVIATGVLESGDLQFTGGRPYGGYPSTLLWSVGHPSHYDETIIQVGTTGTYTLDGAGSLISDGYIWIYTAQIDGANGLVNNLAADDGSGGGGQGRVTVTLNAGQPYWVAVGGYDETQFGAWTLNGSGPGNISVIPEPSTSLLALLGFSVALRRRRRAS